MIDQKKMDEFKQKVKTELAQDLEVKKEMIKEIKQELKQIHASYPDRPQFEKIFNELIEQEHFENIRAANKWHAKYTQYVEDILVENIIAFNYKQK